MIVVKPIEEILASVYVRQKDLERVLNLSNRQAATVFRAAKKDEAERGLVEVSPRKVNRASVERVTGVNFSRLLRDCAARKDAADDVGASSK